MSAKGVFHSESCLGCAEVAFAVYKEKLLLGSDSRGEAIGSILSPLLGLVQNAADLLNSSSLLFFRNETSRKPLLKPIRRTVRQPEFGAGYSTVMVTILRTVLLPEVPVTVTV